MGAFRPRFTVLMACAIVLFVVFSALFAWTYAMDYQRRLGYDMPLDHILDIDGDGLADAYVVEDHCGYGGHDGYATIIFFRNTGGGHLREEARWDAPRTISGLQAGDMDGDGFKEFIAPVLSVSGCNFARTSFLGSGLVGMVNDSFRDGSDLSLGIGQDCDIKGCRFSNTTVYIGLGDGSGNFTFADNTFSGNITLYFSGPADIDTIISSNEFSDLPNEIIIEREVQVSISASWLQNLTTSKVSALYLDFYSLDWSSSMRLSGSCDGEDIAYHATLNPVVAKFNASGKNVLERLPYTLRITLTDGEDMSYEGTVSLGGSGPLELRLE